MTDRIRVTNIAIYAHHGLLEEEARLGQRFQVSLEARLDLRTVGRTDDMADTVSYADMADVAVRIATGPRFKLIEALADAIARGLLDAFPRIESIVVRVDKPSAPIPAIIDTASVEIERFRDG